MRKKAEKNKLQDDKYCFACGPLNPIGLHMEVSSLKDKTICRLTLKREFQGWNSLVHGGVVATILDEIMAHAVIRNAGKAVTTSMHILYRAPMHVGKEIRAEGYVVEKKSRGVLARGEIRAVEDDTVIASGESRFILLT